MTAQVSADRIARDLVDLGLQPGGIALVHSSLRSLVGSAGFLPGGGEAVIQAFLGALGADGTLLMPALSYQFCNAANPTFDVRNTPSNVGQIPETFRLRDGTQRSVCPTHSVCGAGPLAGQLLDEHHLDTTPCGAHSPYRKLADHGGQIVFLGCGLAPNTSMHAVEEVALPTYLFGEMVDYEVVWPDGVHRPQQCRSHNFRGFAQHYERIGSLLSDVELRSGKVIDADTFIVEAKPMWDAGLSALNRDPLHFVEPIAS